MPVGLGAVHMGNGKGCEVSCAPSRQGGGDNWERDREKEKEGVCEAEGRQHGCWGFLPAFFLSFFFFAFCILLLFSC